MYSATTESVILQLLCHIHIAMYLHFKVLRSMCMFLLVFVCMCVSVCYQKRKSTSSVFYFEKVRNPCCLCLNRSRKTYGIYLTFLCSPQSVDRGRKMFCLALHRIWISLLLFSSCPWSWYFTYFLLVYMLSRLQIPKYSNNIQPVWLLYLFLLACCLQCTVQVKLELGHRAQLRKKVTSEGFTHDWMVFVRGPETGDIQHFVERVVFRLHESFPKPKRGETTRRW